MLIIEGCKQVRKHYERKFRERLKTEAAEQQQAGGPRRPEPSATPAQTPFQGSISSVFTPYLRWACLCSCCSFSHPQGLQRGGRQACTMFVCG